MALLLTLSYVRLRTNVFRLSYDINSNMRIENDFLEKNRKLKVEVASLRAPSRIERVASQKLSLKLDGSSKSILLKDYDTKNK